MLLLQINFGSYLVVLMARAFVVIDQKLPKLCQPVLLYGLVMRVIGSFLMANVRVFIVCVHVLLCVCVCCMYEYV